LLFRATGASLARAGVTLISNLDLEFDAARVALIGDWSALFDFLGGRAELTRGELLLLGLDAGAALRSGRVGLALGRAEPNPAWTSAGYLTKGALLDGKPRATAGRDAIRALEALGLGPLSQRTLASLTSVERSAVALARASLSSPELILVEGAFDGLGPMDADWLERVLAMLGERCRLVTSFFDLSGHHLLSVLRHEHVVFSFQGRVVAQGDPRVIFRSGTYLVTAMRHASRLSEGLAALGYSVGAARSLDDAAPTQLLVSSDAPDVSRSIVRVAVEHEVPIIELRPVGLGALPSRQESR
jgi:predicted ABC-type transport system involved in lysophospholipase L1 biosynthesis ATPase subunit